MNTKIFCRCSLFPSWSGQGLISTPVLRKEFQYFLKQAKRCLSYSGHAVPTAAMYSVQQFSQHVMWSLQ
jgi:hypothetical protein